MISIFETFSLLTMSILIKRCLYSRVKVEEYAAVLERTVTEFC